MTFEEARLPTNYVAIPYVENAYMWWEKVAELNAWANHEN